MTSHIIVQGIFDDISFSLQALQEELQKHASELHQQGMDTFDHFRELSLERFGEWEGFFNEASDRLTQLPQELLQQEKVQNFIAELQEREQAVRECFASFQQAGREFYDQNVRGVFDRFFSLMGVLQKEVGAFVEDFLVLKQSAVVRAYLGGKPLLSNRARLQWSRKLYHAASGLFGLWLYAYSGMEERFVLMILGSYFVFALILEIWRKKSGALNDLLCRSMGALMREREREGITSATYYLGSMLFVMAVFPKEVVTLVIPMIALSDPVAGIVGSLWGRHRFSPHVSVEGFLACFVVSVLSAACIVGVGVGTFHLSGGPLLLFSLLAGLTASVAEASFKKWDDNLVIPLVCAPVYFFLVLFFR